jgi:hypothetical protein
VRTTQVTASGAYAASHWNFGGAAGFGVGLNASAAPNKAFARCGDSGITLLGTTTINDGTWHHLALNWTTAGSFQLFKDGSSEGTATGTAWTFTPSLLRLGSPSDGVGLAYVGDIAEVAHYNRNLTTAEIAALAKGMSPLGVAPTALALYAPLVAAENTPDHAQILSPGYTPEDAASPTRSNTSAPHPRIYQCH